MVLLKPTVNVVVVDFVIVDIVFDVNVVVVVNVIVLALFVVTNHIIFSCGQ